MKDPKKMDGKECSELLDEVEGILIECFEINNISPFKAMAGMSSLLLKMASDSGCSKEEFNNYLKGMMNIFKKRY